MTHPDLRHVSNARVGRELERTDALVREVAGRGTRPYFRPPFGARDGRLFLEMMNTDDPGLTPKTIRAFDATASALANITCRS